MADPPCPIMNQKNLVASPQLLHRRRDRRGDDEQRGERERLLEQRAREGERERQPGGGHRSHDDEEHLVLGRRRVHWSQIVAQKPSVLMSFRLRTFGMYTALSVARLNSHAAIGSGATNAVPSL